MNTRVTFWWFRGSSMNRAYNRSNIVQLSGAFLEQLLRFVIIGKSQLI